MEKFNLSKVHLILKSYNLPSRLFLKESKIQIGGLENLKAYFFYFLYIPLTIACLILFVGIYIDFILVKAASLPFMVYAIYGTTIIYKKKSENLEFIILKNGELLKFQKKNKMIFDKSNFLEFKIQIEKLENDNYEGELYIVNVENKLHVLLALYDEDKINLEINLNYIKEVIHSRILM
jgi:hypothetical protein